MKYTVKLEDQKSYVMYGDRKISGFYWSNSTAQEIANELNNAMAALEARSRWRWGVLFRWQSAWVGVHWSPYNKRACINLVPFVTIWITLKGGNVP